MEVVIDFRNYAAWYNAVVLLLLSGTAMLVWTWTVYGIASLVRGHYRPWGRRVRVFIYGATAVTVGNWVVYSLALTSHHLLGWPNIH